MTLTDLKVDCMQSEKLSLALDKDLVVNQSLEKLEGKDETKPLEKEKQTKKSRKSTKVKVAKRLCIFE